MIPGGEGSVGRVACQSIDGLMNERKLGEEEEYDTMSEGPGDHDRGKQRCGDTYS